MRFFSKFIASLLAACSCLSLAAQPVTIRVDASKEIHRVSPFLTGACIEDVNHEIYGGIYSQMIFGESFQEPALESSVDGFAAFGGDWSTADGVLRSPTANGNKLVAEQEEFADGEVAVDVWLEDTSGGNAGLIARTSKPGIGLDRFNGYEIALDPSLQIVRLGRHRNDFTLLKDVSCKIETKQWIRLQVSLKGNQIKVLINGSEVLDYLDSDPILGIGKVGLRQFHHGASYRNLLVKKDKDWVDLPFVRRNEKANAVSRLWKPSQSGDAVGKFEIIDRNPLVGNQSQRIVHQQGDGQIGIWNKGLNGWGLHFEQGKIYEGELYVRAEEPCDLWVAAENSDGSQILAEKKLRVESKEWTKVEFAFTPSQTVRDGRFSLKLKKPSSVMVGYAFLQPGPWGRFEGLPIRRDVAELLKSQGVTMLRYGGSMVNNEQYRWQKMIGPRAMRPPYDGHWYDYSTNGWGILDFMEFCEAAGFEYIPSFNMGETPESMGQFVEYATGDANTEWGKKRITHGHPQPYQLKYLQLGNEESVNLDYAERFKARAKAIWAINPTLTLVVGDFAYDHVITDPQAITGAAGQIKNLDGQRSILEFARENDQEVWFDLHVWTDGPRPTQSLDGMFSFIDALENMKTGAKFKVVVFEFNANNHRQRRAVANALAIHAVERDGRVPVALSANCLQPDGQNDNGWDQGLLFLSPSSVWLQPPGYVTQMYSKNFCSRLVVCEGWNKELLDCNAKLSDDGLKLVCNLVNLSPQPTVANIQVTGFAPRKNRIQVTTFSGALDAANTEAKPSLIVPREEQHDFKSIKEGAAIELQPYSVTTVAFE